MSDSNPRWALEAWKPVRVRRLARFGDDSVDWHGGVAVVEQLVQLRNGGAELTDALREHLEAGLIEVGQPPEPLIEGVMAMRRPARTARGMQIQRATRAATAMPPN